jgi:hypothetical protein
MIKPCGAREGMMEEPCVCDCGKVFDLNYGNACVRCGRVYCKKCLKENFGICYRCKD